MDILLGILFVLVLVLSIVSLRFWIDRARQAGLSGKDIHKINYPEVAEMGGLPVIFAFIVGVFLYLGIRVFLYETHSFSESIFAIVLAVVMAAIIGMVDDILGWKIGLKQWQKPLLTLLVAFPIMALDAGVRIMSIPLFGHLDLGLFYPFFVIPGVMLVGSNGTNMLAGYNGLESGLAGIIIATLGILSYLQNQAWASVLCAVMLIAIMVFYYYNKCPAKVFPGDTFTYATGAFIGAIVIFANLEKAFLILFVPFVIEFFMKAGGRFQKESFAKVQDDGSLKLRYQKLYGLEHVMIFIWDKLGKKVTERKVVYSLLGLQLLFAVMALVL